MSFIAFVNVCKRTYILPQNQATKNVSRRYRKLTVTKFRTRTLWTSMFMIKRAKCFPKKIGQQRRDVIKIQRLIHLNSNAMKTISGSTYQKKLLSLEEIIVSCHWLQRSSLYSSMSGNTWCVTMQDKIFDAKCVVAQEQFFPNGCSSVYLVSHSI